MSTSNITLEKLKKTHGESAKEVFNQIANIGGFGDVPAGYEGGLDISGLDDDKKAAVESLLNKQSNKSKTESGK